MTRGLCPPTCPCRTILTCLQLALDISGISRLGKHPDTQTVHQVLRVASKLSEVLQKHEIGCLDEAALGEKVSVIAMAMAIQGSESTGRLQSV